MDTILKAEKKEAENLTRLFWKEDSDELRFEDFRRVLGAIAWPRMPFPGIILIGGEQLSGKIIIFEETEFKTVSQAAGFLTFLWDQYLPEKYYDIPEDAAFYCELSTIIGDSKKRALAITPFAGDIEYGNQLIEDFLNKDLLRVPANGVLAGQLETILKDGSRPDLNLYGIEALRYLITGFHYYPWTSPEIPLSRRYPLSISEIAALELKEIRKRYQEEQDEEFWFV